MLNLVHGRVGFTSTAEDYFGRVTKAEILDAVTETRGEETAADLKKRDGDRSRTARCRNR